MRATASVLVVGVCCAILAGLVVMAVARVHDAAHRSQCHNNLKQLGLSLENYHDSMSAYPSAAMPNPSLPPEERLSWIVTIIPYVEATSLYSRMDTKAGWQAPKNYSAAGLRVLFLHCPASISSVPPGRWVPSDYVGITGVGEDAALLPLEDERAGFFGYERKLTKKDIRRGLSNLLVVTETMRTEGAWTAAGRPTLRDVTPGVLGAPGHRPELGAMHHGGFNAVFADGSVRLISQKTEQKVLESLATLRESEE